MRSMSTCFLCNGVEKITSVGHKPGTILIVLELPSSTFMVVLSTVADEMTLTNALPSLSKGIIGLVNGSGGVGVREM